MGEDKDNADSNTDYYRELFVNHVSDGLAILVEQLKLLVQVKMILCLIEHAQIATLAIRSTGDRLWMILLMRMSA